MTSFAQRPQAAMAAVFGALTLFLAGCATGLGAGDYRRGEAGVPARVETGVVLSSRSIVFSGGEGIIGGATGAAIGGIAGSQIGGGNEERAIMGIAGAVVGAIIGQQVDRAANNRPGFAYVIRKDNGDSFEVAQGADVVIAPGTPVSVIFGDRVRVVPR
jgi:outer membrane lipoprotein SlyB